MRSIARQRIYGQAAVRPRLVHSMATRSPSAIRLVISMSIVPA